MTMQRKSIVRLTIYLCTIYHLEAHLLLSLQRFLLSLLCGSVNAHLLKSSDGQMTEPPPILPKSVHTQYETNPLSNLPSFTTASIKPSAYLCAWLVAAEKRTGNEGALCTIV